MLRYYTDGIVTDDGDIMLLEQYESLDLWDGKKYVVYLFDADEVKGDWIFKYTHESNIRELIEF